MSIVKVIRLRRREGLSLYWASLKQFWKLYCYARGTGRDRRGSLEFTAIAARTLREEIRTRGVSKDLVGPERRTQSIVGRRKGGDHGRTE